MYPSLAVPLRRFNCMFVVLHISLSSLSRGQPAHAPPWPQASQNSSLPAPFPAPAIFLTAKDPQGIAAFSAALSLPSTSISVNPLQLTSAGTLRFIVTIDGADVAGSNQTLQVVPAQLYAPAAEFSLAADEVAAGGNATVVAVGKDAYGNVINHGGGLFQCVHPAVSGLRYCAVCAVFVCAATSQMIAREHVWQTRTLLQAIVWCMACVTVN